MLVKLTRPTRRIRNKSIANYWDQRWKFTMRHGRILVMSLTALLLFSIGTANSQCTNEMCEKNSLSLKTNTKHNSFLKGYVFETFHFSIWEECFNMCLRKCQCLSFNFNEVNATENCELNDANTKLAPEALKEKEGVAYYEPVRSYNDKKVNLTIFFTYI